MLGGAPPRGVGAAENTPTTWSLMPEQPDAHEHEYAASPPAFRMVCKHCGRRPSKAERWGVEDKAVHEAETK